MALGKGLLVSVYFIALYWRRNQFNTRERRKKTPELEIHFPHDTPIRAKQLCGRRMPVGSSLILFDGSLYHSKVRNATFHKTARSPGLTLGIFLYAQALPSFYRGIYQDSIDIPSRQAG